MGDLLIRNVPDSMKAELSRLADATDRSLSEAAKLALSAGIKAVTSELDTTTEVPLGHRLRSIFAGAFETDDEAEAFRDAIEKERKTDIVRPLPDFE